MGSPKTTGSIDLKRLFFIALIAVALWIVQFLISKNRHAVATIEGEACTLLTSSEITEADIVFYRIGWFDHDGDGSIPADRVNIHRQEDSAGTLDCFVALSDTRCDIIGPAYYRASNRQKTIYFRLMEGEVAILQGNADHLTCTIPVD